MKRFNEDYCQIGFFAIPGNARRTKSHIVESVKMKPICGVQVNGKAQFQWCSFDFKDAECKICKEQLRANRRRAYRKG